MNNAWGTKRNCLKCESHFYDLNKNPAVCPKCNYSFDPTQIGKPRRGRAPRRYLVDEMMMGQKPLAAAKSADKKPKVEKADAGDAGIELDDDDALTNISEIEEISESPNTGGSDDADDESILEDLKKEKVTSIVDVVKEDEEEEDEPEEKKQTVSSKVKGVDKSKRAEKKGASAKKVSPKKK